ncbi:MAG: hypothetical protein HYV27_05965 [Candidatus Hydrogenedentes bacterium]|nr:hypothetical protein [Candidatus Hydrogenedentota bacterium]
MSLLLLLSSLLSAITLPTGNAPVPVGSAHFPDALHAFVWRNWPLVPLERMAQTVGATEEQLLAIGQSMGLDAAPVIMPEQESRAYITVIRRNWHLLPYEQLLTLLGWEAEKLDFVLREDDFLYIKLGRHKPAAPPIVYAAPDAAAQARAAQIKAWVQSAFPSTPILGEKPLFSFVEELTAPLDAAPAMSGEQHFNPRYCSSYFGLYGDLFSQQEVDPFPPAYLARLKQAGVSGIWIPVLLYQLAPFPWDPALSENHEAHLKYLGEIAARLKGQGISLFLYLNEPRALPHAFFEAHPELKGVSGPELATLCTSLPEVRDWMRGSVERIARAVPELGGFFTITASENMTSCWSHGIGAQCPRCKERSAAQVIAEVNRTLWEGITAAGSKAEFFAWDWGWGNDWAGEVIAALPKEIALMSVSEWDLPIVRGGVDSQVGEYSVSSIGPGPRAERHWKLARERGMKTMAKIQANNTWEISTVPYVPAVANVAEHARRLREAGVEGLMLGWTLGGYPSPNLEVVSAMGADTTLTPEAALQQVAEARFGEEAAPLAVRFWQSVSTAYSEFPYHIGTVYNGPMQLGPANLLWFKPTGYASTMVCFPYDDLNSWRAVYPPEVFIGQFEKMAQGFNAAADALEAAAAPMPLHRPQVAALESEIRIARVCAIHFQSVANQSSFVLARDARATAEGATRKELTEKLIALLHSEIGLAKKLHALQSTDTRFGYEASNHYFFVPVDLVEKVINCEALLAELAGV